MLEEQICTRVGDGSSGATKGQDFSSRKESTSVTATSSSSSSIPNRSLDTSDYRKTSPTTRSDRRGGYISHTFNARDERTQQDPILWAAMNDLGVDAQFAEHVRNSSTEELREEFEHAKALEDDIEGYETKKKFLGGVLISRGDESVAVDDVVEVRTIDSIDDFDSPGELDEFTKQSLRETFEFLDEYVCGQLCSDLHSITSDDTSIDTAGRYVAGIGQLKMNTDAIETKDQFEHTLRHELMHGIHREVYGLTDDKYKNYTFSVQTGNARPSPARLKPPDEMDFSMNSVDGVVKDPFETFRRTATSSESWAIDDRVKELGDKLIATRKGLDPVGMNCATRYYQFSDGKEFLTCAFAEYSTNFVKFYAAQPEAADLLDEFVTGATWDKTSLDELQGKETVDISATNSRNRAGRAGGDEGEIVRIKHGPNVPKDVTNVGDPYDDEIVGYVSEVNPEKGTLTIIRGGFEIEVYKDQIEDIERRNWDSSLDLDMMQERNDEYYG